MGSGIRLGPCVSCTGLNRLSQQSPQTHPDGCPACSWAQRCPFQTPRELECPVSVSRTGAAERLKCGAEFSTVCHCHQLECQQPSETSGSIRARVSHPSFCRCPLVLPEPACTRLPSTLSPRPWGFSSLFPDGSCCFVQRQLRLHPRPSETPALVSDDELGPSPLEASPSPLFKPSCGIRLLHLLSPTL